MNAVVCILCFIAINAYGAVLLFGGGEYQVKPVTGYVPWRFSGPEMFVLLTLGGAMLAASTGGLLMYRLLLWIVLIALGLFKYKMHLSLISILYSIYIMWLLIGLTYTAWIDFGIRQLAKYLLPLLLLLFVPQVIKNTNVFHKGIQLVFLSYAIWAFLHVLRWCGLGFIISPIAAVFWWGPAILDSYGVILSICAVKCWLSKDRRFLWLLLVIFMIPLIGYVVRTAFVVLLIAAMAMAFFKYKVMSIPYILAILVMGIAMLVFIPGLRDKMFYKNYSSDDIINTGFSTSYLSQINSNGRFAMWEELLGRFYYPHPLTGSGLGSQQKYMYVLHEQRGVAGIAHCDYVQMLCDSGIIGIVLYALVSISFIASCFFMYNNKRLINECRYSAFIAGTSLCGLLAAMITDNVVNYTMTTLAFPYTFYGMALGLRRLKID